METNTKPSARLSAHQWRQIIKQQHESSLSPKAFCQSRNIGLSTFNTWKSKLEKKADSLIDQLQPEASSDWIELPPYTQETTASASWHIELELPGGAPIPAQLIMDKKIKASRNTNPFENRRLLCTIHAFK